jgi:hypothetical protein
MSSRIATRMISVAAAVMAMSGLAGCGLFGGKHEVGECVRTGATLGGTDIETVDCPADDVSLVENMSDPIYQISEVLDYEASCANDGRWGIELKHEPDDAVYCLVPVV